MSLDLAVRRASVELFERALETGARMSRRELESIATLAVVVEFEGGIIRADGCGPEKANNFAQFNRQLRADAEALGDTATGTFIAYALVRADTLSASMLALTEPAGNA